MKRILDHQSSSDFIDRERLQRILERANPLQPPKDRGDIVQVDEETGECHLIQCGESGEEDGDATVTKETGEQEVLWTKRVGGSDQRWCERGTHIECHYEGIENEDEEELEEMGCVVREAGHPIRSNASLEIREHS